MAPDGVTSTDILLYFLKTAAPERGHLVDEFTRANTLSLAIIKDRHDLHIAINTKSGRIEIGYFCISRLWARAYAYSYAWQEMLAASALGGRVFELDANHFAIKLLHWSLICELNVTLSAIGDSPEFSLSHESALFPTGGPSPFSHGPDDKIALEASDRWKFAMCFIMHHEFAHFVLRHESRTGFPSIEEEKAADRHAADWMLEGLGEASKEFGERSAGIGLALVWLVSTEVHTGPVPSDSHPPAYDRLYQLLDHCVKNPNHETWHFVALVLRLHFISRYDGVIVNLEFESAKFEVNHFSDLISKM